ncbi:MAG: DNA repair protein RecO [Cytophagales bacterium]
MLHKTRGIALSYIKFKETSIIAKIYTEEFGLQTYIQNGVRSAKSSTKIAFFQPLTLLDLVVYYKNGQDIHRISEIKCSQIYITLHSDFKKITVATFLTEILSKCIHEGDTNTDLFEFLIQSLISFDKQTTDFTNFHIHFLFELSTYLGFHPQSFDELKMQLIQYRNSWINVFEDDSLKFVCVSLIEGIHTIQINGHQRRLMIDLVLDFYQSHVENFGEIKSLKVLREL